MSNTSSFIRLDNVPTIGQLYKKAILKPLPSDSDEVRYKADASLLNRISLIMGDITKLEVDAIVNAANKSLLGGGGVDGAIHDAAGIELLKECRTLNGCDTGYSKITRGYRLPARHVIHTVGPRYSRSQAEKNAEQLKSCYKTSLDVAIENSVRSIAFPCVSTGIYDYPIKDATRTALDEVRRFCDSEIGAKLERVVFVIWKGRNEDLRTYMELIPMYFPPTPEIHEEGQEEDEQKADVQKEDVQKEDVEAGHEPEEKGNLSGSIKQPAAGDPGS